MSNFIKKDTHYHNLLLNTLTVKSVSTLSTLTVNGNSELCGEVHVCDNLVVDGNVESNSVTTKELIVNGNSELCGNVHVCDNLVVDGNIIIPITNKHWSASLTTATQIITFPNTTFGFLNIYRVVFDNTFSNPYNSFDTTMGIFTIPIDGIYTFDIELNYRANGNFIGNKITTELIKLNSLQTISTQIKSVRRNLVLQDTQEYDEVFSITLPCIKNEQYAVGTGANTGVGLTVNVGNAYLGGLLGLPGITRTNLRITKIV